MFRICRERHTYTNWSSDARRQPVSTEVWIDAEVLRRDDGLAVVRLGQQPSFNGGTFRYTKDDVTFDFYANRSHPGGTITGTYSVRLEFKRGQKLGHAVWPLARTRVDAFAADIDAALRAWPTPGIDIPVGVIEFLVYTFGAVPGSGCEPSADKADDYTFALGRPVATRHVPPSMRWQLRTIAHRRLEKWSGIEVTRDRDGLVRDDGVELIRIRTMRGPGTDGPDTYYYVDRHASFAFEAERRVGLGLMTDTWEVRLDPRSMEGLRPALRVRLDPKQCAEIVANIEEALYAWPHDQGYEYETPINRVVFLDADVVCRP